MIIFFTSDEVCALLCGMYMYTKCYERSTILYIVLSLVGSFVWSLNGISLQGVLLYTGAIDAQGAGDWLMMDSSMKRVPYVIFQRKNYVKRKFSFIEITFEGNWPLANIYYSEEIDGANNYVILL